MLLYLLSAIVLLLCGVLAASSVIVSSKPNAAEFIGKIAPYQESLGLTSLILGVAFLIDIVFHMSFFNLGHLLIALGVAGVQIALGLLFGYATVTRFTSADAARGIDEVRRKLMPYQIPLGFAGIVLGILGILSWL